MAQLIKPSLIDAYLKTTRAKVHLDALKDELDRFRNAKPFSIVREDDIEGARHRISVHVGDTPPALPLIVGDLFYCLRSSLDQAVWSLAHLTIPYPEQTQFPILDSPNPKRFAICTKGVSAEAKAIIESLQPYQTTDTRSHLLWRLNRMCNIDKHRRIPVHGAAVVLNFPGMRKTLSGHIEFDHENGALSVPMELKEQMRINPDISFKVVFGDMSDGIACDFAGIEAIYKFVSDEVLPRFARFFE